MHDGRIFFIVFIAIFVVMLGVGVIAPTMPLYAKTLGATGIGLGFIYSSFSFSRAIFMPVAGKLSDRRGRKIFLIMGLTIYAIVSLGYIWSNSVGQMIWIRFLHGIGSAMVIPIASAVIGDISPRGREGSIMGTFQVAMFLGFGAGPLLGGVVLSTLGMAEVFYVMGGMSCVSLSLIIAFLPEKENIQMRKKSQVSRFRLMWHYNIFKGLLFFRLVNAVGRGSIIAFLPIFATKMNISPSQIGLLISLNIILTGVLQHFFGKLADRMNRSFLIIIGGIIGAIPLLLTPLAQNFNHLLYLGIVMGLGGGIAFPAAGALATELGRDHGMGNVMGFFNMSMSFGMIIGPIIAGLLMDLLSISGVFIFGGSIGLLGMCICCYWMIYRKEVSINANI